jgi:hypothetical protein
MRRTRLIWATLLCVSFPFAIVYPFLDAFLFRRVSLESTVPFEFANALLSTSSILFGFSSLLVVSKEWIDRRIWVVLLPPLSMIVLSGVSISDLALGAVNPVQALLLCSATFNANVVSTAFIASYVVINLRPKRGTRR